MRFSEDSLLTKFTKAELLKLAEDPAVEYIEPERYFNADLADAVSITRASTAWTRRVNGTNLTGAGESICVIDTGIDFTHPSLSSKNAAGCIVNCYLSSCALNCTDSDFAGHGTHVAGIAAATGGIAGIAPGPNLIGVKVFA